MDPISLTFVISAFIAGIITFLAPCTLPLVPGYLSFISGASVKDLQDPEKAHRARLKIFLNGLFYVVGFSTVFIIFGTLFGLGGSLLFAYRDTLIILGGAFVVFFGMFLFAPALSILFDGLHRLWKVVLGIPMLISGGFLLWAMYQMIQEYLLDWQLHVLGLRPLQEVSFFIEIGITISAIIFILLSLATFLTNKRVNFIKFITSGIFAAEHQSSFGRKLTPGKPVSSLIFGASFAVGWSPCVGPVLGIILTFAASSATVGQGAFLLFVFSLGLAIPFLLTALAIGWAATHFVKIAKYLNYVSIVGGIFLIILGYLMISGNFIILNSLVFQLLDQLGLGMYEERLLDLL